MIIILYQKANTCGLFWDSLVNTWKIIIGKKFSFKMILWWVQKNPFYLICDSSPFALHFFQQLQLPHTWASQPDMPPLLWKAQDFQTQRVQVPALSRHNYKVKSTLTRMFNYRQKLPGFLLNGSALLRGFLLSWLSDLSTFLEMVRVWEMPWKTKRKQTAWRRRQCLSHY